MTLPMVVYFFPSVQIKELLVGAVSRKIGDLNELEAINAFRGYAGNPCRVLCADV